MSSPSKSERRAQVIAILRQKIPPKTPAPKRVYGLRITDDRLLAFGIMMRRRVDPKFDESNPTQLQSSKYLALEKLPLMCLFAIPALWLTRWHACLVRTSKYGVDYVIVMADDGSEEAKSMKNTPETVQEVVKFLGLGDQKPAWYSVALY